MKEIKKEEIQDLINDDKSTLIVDIREPEQFEEYNLGGINIPSHEITRRLDELKDADNIIVVCSNGTVASIMARIIEQRTKDKKVYYLEEGIY